MTINNQKMQHREYTRLAEMQQEVEWIEIPQPKPTAWFAHNMKTGQAQADDAAKVASALRGAPLRLLPKRVYAQNALNRVRRQPSETSHDEQRGRMVPPPTWRPAPPENQLGD